MKDWLYTQEIYNLKPGSFDRKENTCVQQVFPYIGSLPVKRVTIDDIESFVQSLRMAGYSYSTIKKAYEAVHACFRFYQIHRKIPTNPADGVRVSSGGRKLPLRVKYYTQPQLQMIQRECLRCYSNNIRVYPQGDLIIILANTGIRVGELLALTWNDVDFFNRSISIEKNAVQLKCRENNSRPEHHYKQFIQDSAKTSSSIRIVPLNQTAYDAFQRLRKISNGKGLVAQSRHGKALNHSNIARTLKRILQNLNFPANMIFGPHALRHSFASALISKGADIKKVSSILGHSSVTITYDYYIHFIPQDFSSTVELLDSGDI